MSDDAPSKRPVEEWALAKGLLRPGYNPANRYISSARGHSHFVPWLFAMAKHAQGWGIGHEVTEQDFDAAITDAGSITAS